MKEIIACLEERYGRTRLEKMEELVLDWIGFRDDDYEDEGDFLHAMEELQRRKEDRKITDREWNIVLMLKKSQKRKGMCDFQNYSFRDVLKVEGDTTKEFIEKYKDVRLRTSRGKVVNIQYSMSMMYVVKECLSRRRSQEQRERRESRTRRHDSQGRVYERRFDRLYSRDGSYSLRMVEQEDSTMNGHDQENRGKMDMIGVDQEVKVNTEKKEKKKKRRYWFEMY